MQSYLEKKGREACKSSTYVKLTAQKGQGRDKEGEPAVKFLLSSSHSGISREQVAGHISNFTLSDGKVQINEEIRSLEHFIGFY